MLPWVKEFIENNIDLLDTNPQEFFLRSWEENKLDASDVAYMSTILSDAGISFDDINEWRNGALLQILNAEILAWAFADGGVSSMPVYEFIEVFLDNRVGYDSNYVLLFIAKHSERWDKYVEIYVENNMTIISRR